MIFIAGISIGLFISALLIVKKNKSKSDIFLILLMLLNVIHLCFFNLTYTDSLYDYPSLLGLQFPLSLLPGVLLYYYVSSVTHQFPKKTVTALLHLIPALLTLAYLVPFLLLPAEQKIEIFKNEGREYALFQQVVTLAVFILGIVYVIWSGFILRNHKKRIKIQFSNIEEINLKWLQLLIYGLGLVWVFIIVTQNNLLIYTSMSVFVILIGFFGLQQRTVFRPPTALSKDKKKYSKSGLSKEKEEYFYTLLKKLILEEKIYTNPELSLNDLANELDIHPNYLSQIINNKEKKTFYDYINTYRVEEFKRRISIPENQQFTLITIAYDCGFNSKSTFNRYFKKITETTPSQYVRSLKP